MKIRAFGQDYQVKYEECPGGDSDGYWSSFPPKIIIDPENAHDETLLHEVVHIVSYHLGQDLSEEQVTAMSAGLFGIFRDNPELLNSLRGETDVHEKD